MAYSFSLTTFNPSGKLLQIEYALKAVNRGRTSVGIRATNGVVLATEKVLPTPLIEADSVEKVCRVTDGIAMVYSGMGQDYRVLLRRARKEALRYEHMYHEEIPVLQLVRSVAAVMQQFTQQGGVRPFGVSVLVAGLDHTGPQLYQVDPSGSYFGWKATAMGKNYIDAKTFLEKRYSDELELEDAIHTALLTLKEGFDGEMTAAKLELARVDANGKVHKFTEEEIADYLEEAE
jgi:20S proteasome subunit alpha 2